MAKRGRKPLEERGKPGRKPGSKNKEKVESETNLMKLALTIIQYGNDIGDLKMAVRSMSDGLNNLVQNVNKHGSEVAKRVQVVESRMADIEKAISKDKPEESKEGESLT